MTDPTDAVPDFEGRDALEALLREILPAGWEPAVRAGDNDAVFGLKDPLDKAGTVRRLGEEGWIAPHFSPEFGGRGLSRSDAESAVTLLDVWEVPRTPGGAGLALAAPTIDQWSTDETKRRLLPPLFTGAERWCQLFSEPGSGSDMASLATTAVRDGDEWVVNGQKVWTTFGHKSEMGMLIARTDPGQPKHKGITYFALDMRQPGVEVRPLVNIAGQAEFNEIFMTDARVPDLQRISPVGEGWGAAMTTLSAERYALSGRTRKKRKSSQEVTGGRPIDEVVGLADGVRGSDAEQAVDRQRAVGAHVDGQLLSMVVKRARARAAAGHPPGPESSISKLMKSTSNQALMELGMDLRGAESTAWDADDEDAADWVEQFLRTRANSIEGGTSEVQRNILGERVLGLPREPDPYKGEAWRDIPRS